MKYPKLNEKQIKELKDIIHNDSSSNQEIKKAQVVLIIDKRKKIKDISEITGLKRSRIFELRKRYLKQGIIAIKDKRKKNPKDKEDLLSLSKTFNFLGWCWLAQRFQSSRIYQRRQEY